MVGANHTAGLDNKMLFGSQQKTIFYRRSDNTRRRLAGGNQLTNRLDLKNK
jgi:hypothetical protein